MYPVTLSPSKKRGYKGDLDLDAKYMTAVVGEDYTRDSLDFDCERISNMLRAMTAISFKLNLGSDNLRKDHDGIPAWVFDKEPDFKAFDEGTVKMDRDDMEKPRRCSTRRWAGTPRPASRPAKPSRNSIWATWRTSWLSWV